jgi:alkane 1-monooxygenase
MKFKDLKYLAAFIAPVLAAVAIFKGGNWVWSVIVFAFVLVPILEQFLPQLSAEYEEEEKEARLASFFFDLLLIINIPIIYGLLYMLGINLGAGIYSNTETVGLVISLGIVLGASGINVAHELGHRGNKFYQFFAKVLLLPCLYIHFFIEHNRGHHMYVSTPEDPASARRGEVVYFFFIRSIVKSYAHAWALENKRLKGKWLSFSNKMIQFTLITAAYIATLFLLFAPLAATLLLVSGLISILLLETINYIEHYGLQRKKLENGRYERVMPHHSWNSNHIMGRIILYELTRHSDHHFQSSKEYQILEHHPNSPQLPLGYPASMLMALLPPVWFKVMDKRLPAAVV